MRKKIIFSLSLIVFAVNINAQLLSLDRYAIPLEKKGAVVGKFVAAGSQPVSIVKDEAGIFVIENGALSLNKKTALSAGAPMSYLITVKCGNDLKTFELVKDEFIRNKVIAHRGAWRHTGKSQNSLGSLRKAIEMGCEGSEFDLYLTRDKRLAINHDGDFDGMLMEKTTLARLHTVPLSDGELMPTLEDFIALIKTQNKTRLVLEFKSSSAEVVDSAVNMIHRLHAQAWVDYISFNYKVLKHVRALDPTAATAYLGGDNIPMDVQKIDGMTGIDYNQGEFDKDTKVYERARMLGLTVNVWTVDDEAQLRRFLKMGVDYITTNEPEMLLEMVKK